MKATRKQKTQAEIDLDRKAQIVRRKIKALGGLHRRSLETALDIGRILVECQDQVVGGWMAWLARKHIEYDTAQRLMNLFRWSQADPRNFGILQNSTSITQLYTFARYALKGDLDLSIVRRLEAGEKVEPGTIIRPKKPKTRAKRKASPATVTISPSDYVNETPPQPLAPAEQLQQPEPLQAAAPAETQTNGHAAAAEPQPAPPDDAAGAAFLAAIADHPPPDNITGLLASFHAQSRLSAKDIDHVMHILVSLHWRLREDEPPPPSDGGRPH